MDAGTVGCCYFRARCGTALADFLAALGFLGISLSVGVNALVKEASKKSTKVAKKAAAKAAKVSGARWMAPKVGL